MDYPGEIRHRLVWWDYDTYKNQPTTVAIINQVDYIESSFAFKTKVETNVDVAAKGVSGGWTASVSIKVSKLVGNELKWSLAATNDDSKYWREICKTQYDYRLEEYAVEQYQDNGDTWEWVRIDTQYKFYAHGLNANPTPYGELECTSTPPSGTMSIVTLTLGVFFTIFDPKNRFECANCQITLVTSFTGFSKFPLPL